jgi:tetratricopeptide (TPR) repeat protein
MKDIELLEEQAIDAAVNADWDKAIELNLRILAINEKNLGAHLRLGFAYMQNNAIAEAQKSYKTALSIQPKNHIALENMERLEVLAGKKLSSSGREKERFDPDLFLETPGKTKTINLVNIGQKDDIASLIVGQAVELKLKKRKVEVRTKDGVYVGTLPDDLSRRMMYFLQEGSTYKANIKEATLNTIVLFVREIEKGTKVRQLVSFPQNSQMNIPPNKPPSDQETTDEETDDEDSELEEEADMPEEVDKDLLRYQQGQEDEESEE